jgi:hypothetical protein
MKAKLKEFYWIMVDVFIGIIYLPIELFKQIFNL